MTNRRRLPYLILATVMMLGVTLPGPVANAATSGGDWPQPWHDEAGTLANLEETAISVANAKSLRVVWHRSPTFGLTNPAVVDGGVAYYGDGLENVFAVDAATGVKRWQHSFPDHSYVDGVVVGPTMLYATLDLWPEGTGAIYAFDKRDGRVVWRYLPPEWSHIYGPGILVGNRLYVYFYQGLFLSLDASTGKVIWENKGGAVRPEYGMSYANGLIYTQNYDHRRAAAASAATGQLLWEYSEAADGAADIAFPPPVADGIVFVATSEGEGEGYVAAFPATGCESDCRAVWRARLPGQPYGQPAIASGRVFVPTVRGPVSYLVALDEFSGRQLWEWEGPRELDGVSVAGDVVYAVAQEWNAVEAPEGVYAFAAAGCGAPTCQPLANIVLEDSFGLLPPVVANGTVVVTGNAVWGLRPTTSVAPPLNLVAATGTDRALRYRRSDRTTWTNLGGRLYATPTVVPHPNGTQFLGEHGDQRVYGRTIGSGWIRLSASVCRKPAAAISQDRVYVTCIGSDNVLRTASGTVREGRLKSLGTFASLGATAPTGGAVTVVNGEPLYARTGSDRRAYVRTPTSAWRALPMYCSGRVALARGGGATFAACRDSAGALRWTRDVGAGFSRVITATGAKIVGDVGLAVDRTGRATVYAKGSDNAVYRVVVGGKPAQWQRLTGAAIYGVTAAQLRP